MENISFNKFISLLTSQPYFVWNKVNNNKVQNDDDLQFDIFHYEDLFADNLQEAQIKSSNIINDKFNKKVIDQLPKTHVISSKKLENKINETIAAIQDSNIDTIINPVFGFIYKNFQIIAQPKIYFKKNKEISFLKISTSTKLKDILRFMFDYMVLQKIGIKINDASLYVLETTNYKKGDVDFYKTKYINTTKTSRSVSLYDKYVYNDIQLEKVGQGIDEKGNNKEKYSIFQILTKGKISKKKNVFVFKSLYKYLDKIIEAKKINQITYPIDEDNSIFSDNKNWNVIMKKINHKWFNYSGHLIPKKSIIEKFSEKEISSKSKVFSKMLENKILIKDKQTVIKTLNELNQKIIWYDFEAFSTPISPMDNVLPFHQVVYQVSIIKTFKMKEIEIQNIILDPQKINANDFETIINSIYNDDHKYVVYNKAYENTKLQEMLDLLELQEHKNFHHLSKKVNKIIDNTIDLADFFICNKNKMPMILIPELKGRYSIKIIENYINNNKKLDILYKIKKYKDLKVQNGMMAMGIANNRNLGILRYYQWEQAKNLLKEYCENDVRVMIMVYYFIEKILNTY